MRRIQLALVLGIALALTTARASGQQLIIKGMYGMMSGTMAVRRRLIRVIALGSRPAPVHSRSSGSSR